MMGNKWMQGGIMFGAGFGLIIGGVLCALDPLIPFAIGFVLSMLSMYWCANARGTDGWGGPWNGPKD